jgi:hypothetical protein
VTSASTTSTVTYTRNYERIPTVLLSVRDIDAFQARTINYRMTVTPSQTTSSVFFEYTNMRLIYALVNILSFDTVANGVPANSFLVLGNSPNLAGFNDNLNLVRTATIEYNIISLNLNLRPVAIFFLHQVAFTNSEAGVTDATLESRPGFFGAKPDGYVVTLNSVNMTVICSAGYSMTAMVLTLFVYNPVAFFRTNRQFSVNSFLLTNRAEELTTGVAFEGNDRSYIGSYTYFEFTGISRFSYTYKTRPSATNSYFINLGPQAGTVHKFTRWAIQLFLPIFRDCTVQFPYFYRLLCYDVCPEGFLPNTVKNPECVECTAATCSSFSFRLIYDNSTLKFPKYYIQIDFSFFLPSVLPPFSVSSELPELLSFHEINRTRTSIFGEVVILQEGVFKLSVNFASTIVFTGRVLRSSKYELPAQPLYRSSNKFFMLRDTKYINVYTVVLQFRNARNLTNITDGFINVRVDSKPA